MQKPAFSLWFQTGCGQHSEPPSDRAAHGSPLNKGPLWHAPAGLQKEVSLTGLSHTQHTGQRQHCGITRPLQLGAAAAALATQGVFKLERSRSSKQPSDGSQRLQTGLGGRGGKRPVLRISGSLAPTSQTWCLSDLLWLAVSPCPQHQSRTRCLV